MLITLFGLYAMTQSCPVVSQDTLDTAEDCAENAASCTAAIDQLQEELKGYSYLCIRGMPLDHPLLQDEEFLKGLKKLSDLQYLRNLVSPMLLGKPRVDQIDAETKRVYLDLISREGASELLEQIQTNTIEMAREMELTRTKYKVGITGLVVSIALGYMAHTGMHMVYLLPLLVLSLLIMKQ